MMNLLLFAVIGATEWVLAVLRMRACIEGKALYAGLLVFLETVLGLWVFREYAAGNNWAGIAYAMGGAFGTYLGVKFKRITEVGE